MESRPHTFLFADISGYSALAELEGDEAAAEVAISFAAKASRLAAEHGAEVVRQIGDAVMVHCQDAAKMIEFGLRLHAELGAEAEDRSLPPIHAGIHTGPALERAGDWWGTTVNVAARVAAAAGAGELLVTEAAKRAAGERAGTQLSAPRALRLKNISAPVSVYSTVTGRRTARGGGHKDVRVQHAAAASRAAQRRRCSLGRAADVRLGALRVA
jgi:class 3 adenylate cyclase